MTEIIAAIAQNPRESAIQAAREGADAIEIRIDLINHPADSLCQLVRELKETTELPIIATNRMSAEDGQFTGSEEDRIAILLSVLEIADSVDIELRADRKYRDMVVNRAKDLGKRVIVSYHDFSETPDTETMQEILSDCFAAGADIAKLATTPNSYRDALRLLELTLDCAPRSVCIIGMGGFGAHTRLVAPIYGSALAYASVGAATAPGQLKIQELRDMLRLLHQPGAGA